MLTNDIQLDGITVYFCADLIQSGIKYLNPSTFASSGTRTKQISLADYSFEIPAVAYLSTGKCKQMMSCY